MLTCKELSERATDYLENALSPAQRAGIKMHLLMCKHCQAYVDQLAKTVKLLKAAGDSAAELTPDPALLAKFRSGTAESQG
ncbi:anti-sigma factor family protein [Devosia sp.]|uniref:anti-sigma factor family protein n=1 Tax=Devosia sp. TaxID=1871048 RepID=UPI0037C1ADD8